MDRTIQKALYIILIALGLAFVFNFLFFQKPIGISVFIFFTALLVALFLFGRREQLAFKNSWWLMLLVAFFSFMPGVRANEFLTFLNFCATLGLLLLLAHQLVGTPVFVLKIWNYITLAVFTPLLMVARAFSTLGLIGQIHSTVKRRDVWVRVIKGIILALPILILFAALFSQADLAFSKFLSGIIQIHISLRTVQYLIMLAFGFGCALSFLSYIFFPKAPKLESLAEQPSPAPKAAKGIEVMVFLGLICALFLIFIIFQITYLFGGQTNIVNAGFTYAEYARRGFWELLVVALLSLLVLLAAEKYAGAETKKDRNFLIPALILIAEVIVVMVSAFKRLSLYIDAYSLTDMRFYVAGFIILLFVLFILLAIKFIKARPENFFAFGTLLSAISFLIVINLLNPDAFIAKSNLAQFGQTGKIDVTYVGRLSADAEAQKIEIYKKLEGVDKDILGRWLAADNDNLEKDAIHWQSASFSRAKALKLLKNVY